MDASADARPPKPGLLEATAILTLISGIVVLAFEVEAIRDAVTSTGR